MNFRQRFRMWLAWWNFREQFDATAAQVASLHHDWQEIGPKFEGLRYDVSVVLERQQQFQRILMQQLAEVLRRQGVSPEQIAKLGALSARLDAGQEKLRVATTDPA